MALPISGRDRLTQPGSEALSDRDVKHLIVNADGYGFTTGVNRGIEETVEPGIVTSNQRERELHSDRGSAVIRRALSARPCGRPPQPGGGTFDLQARRQGAEMADRLISTSRMGYKGVQEHWSQLDVMTSAETHREIERCEIHLRTFHNLARHRR